MGVGSIEPVAVGNLVLGFLSESNTLIVVDLLYSVRFSSRTRLVASDVVTGDEDAVAWDNLARLEEGNITDEQFLDVNDMFDAATDDLDPSFLLLVVEDTKLSLLLPIVERTNHHL